MRGREAEKDEAKLNATDSFVDLVLFTVLYGSVIKKTLHIRGIKREILPAAGREASEG